MHTRIFLATTTCFTVSLAAQQAQNKGKMGDTMKDAMAGHVSHMAEMQGEHREMAQLVGKITQSFASIQSEKDPVALARKLAEHSALLKQLEAKIEAGSKMMEKMEKTEKDEAAPPAEHKH